MSGVHIECACRKGEAVYLELLRGVGCSGDLFERLGPHPTFWAVVDMVVAATGSPYVPEAWRIGLLRDALVLYWDPGLSSRSFNDTIDYLLSMRSVGDGVQIVGSRGCSVYLDCVNPTIDGFCYLDLYPEDQWVRLAAQCGRWPKLSELPPGRYPAVAKQVVVGFVRSLAVHCERAASDGDFDELARFPGIACVGGGSADVSCSYLGAGYYAADPCKSCLRVPQLTCAVGDPKCGCPAALRPPGSAEIKAAQSSMRYVHDGKMKGSCCFVKGVFPVEWNLESRCDITCLEVDKLSPVVCHVSTDPVYHKVVSVTGDRWMLQFPTGSRVAFGDYHFDCKSSLTLVGMGPADIRCSLDRDWVLGRGLSSKSRNRFMHLCLGCDPTDGTARMTSAVDCPVYYAADVWAQPLASQDWVSYEFPEPDDYWDALVEGRLLPGKYVFHVLSTGLVVRPRHGWVVTGDLIVGPKGRGVCLVVPHSLEMGLAESVTVPVIVGCDRDGKLPTGWKACYVLSLLAAMDGMVELSDQRDGSSSCAAVVTEVANDYCLDGGGPSSDGFGGCCFGEEFD